MKERNNSQAKMRPYRRRRRCWWKKYQKLFFIFEYTFTFCIYDATLGLLRQVLSCLYICLHEHMHMSVCVWSREHLHMRKQMFCVSPTWSGSDPSIFLSSPSPLLSFREHLFFGAMWVTPASQRRALKNQVTLQSGRHWSWKCKGSKRSRRKEIWMRDK